MPAGVQDTGIGCPFNDVVHRALGLDTAWFQDIYHFTAGKAIVNARLRHESAYAHFDADTMPSMPRR